MSDDYTSKDLETCDDGHLPVWWIKSAYKDEADGCPQCAFMALQRLLDVKLAELHRVLDAAIERLS